MSTRAPGIVLSRAQIERVRPAADAFAEAVVNGARGVARIARDGSVKFGAAGVSEMHDELHAALTEVLAGTATELIEARSGSPLTLFIDRAVVGWLRAEPTIGEFLRTDPRGNGAFLFDVLRADLGEIGVTFDIEPGTQGYRCQPTASRRRFILPVAGGAWVGAGLGFMVQMAGVADAATLGFFAGVAFGILLALYAGARRGPASCSECGGAVEHTASRCARCGTLFPDLTEADADEIGADADSRE